MNREYISKREYRLSDKHLECYVDDNGWQIVGGKIGVLARTQGISGKGMYGAILWWNTSSGKYIQEVISIKDLRKLRSTEVYDFLNEKGYWFGRNSNCWSLLKEYLLDEIEMAPQAIVVDKMGWHGNVFVGEGWSLGGDEGYHFINYSDALTLKSSGEFDDWKNNIGALCVGNPMMIFSIGVALAAPVLKKTDTENGIFHIRGASSTGKTTLLELGASVYSDRSYMMSWVATENGLAAAAATRNDLLFLLDEIGSNVSKDIGAVIYHLIGGVSKQRANKFGALSGGVSWRTLGLSSGEISLTDMLLKEGEKAKAGQEIRLLEIPAFGNFGVFNNLHGFTKPQLFVDHLKKQMKLYYGSLLIEWITLLTGLPEALGVPYESDCTVIQEINSEKERISNLWISSEMSSQVVRSLQRFALIAATLSVASQNKLLPWDKEESIRSVKECWDQWIKSRGHVMNSEDFELLTRLKKASFEWISKLSPISEYKNPDLKYFLMRKNEAEIWLIDTDEFKESLNLPLRSQSQITNLISLGLLHANEATRGTYKYSGRRFFAVYPEALNKMLEGCDDA